MNEWTLGGVGRLMEATYRDLTNLPPIDQWAVVDVANTMEWRYGHGPRNNEIVWRYFDAQQSIREIADAVCLSRTRVDQILKKALRRYRHPNYRSQWERPMAIPRTSAEVP